MPGATKKKMRFGSTDDTGFTDVLVKSNHSNQSHEVIIPTERCIKRMPTN